MRFESRTFWLPKDSGSPEQYQDAFDLDPQRGVAAIADGVTSGIFSGPWARLLTQAIVAQPPSLEDESEFHSWLAQLRSEWLSGIDIGRLTWFQRPKMVDGGMTTLLWVELTPLADSHGTTARHAAPVNADPNADENRVGDVGDDPERLFPECSVGDFGTSQEPVHVATTDVTSAAVYRLRSYAIGDSFLYHVRAGQVLAMFPFDNSAAFGLNPAVIGSFDRNSDDLLQFQMIERECSPGDLLVLCTDALALWAMQGWEAGEPVDWERYWNMSADVWQEEMISLRRESLMRYDDTTLILLRISSGVAF